MLMLDVLVMRHNDVWCIGMIWHRCMVRVCVLAVSCVVCRVVFSPT